MWFHSKLVWKLLYSRHQDTSSVFGNGEEGEGTTFLPKCHSLGSQAQGGEDTGQVASSTTVNFSKQRPAWGEGDMWEADE